MIAAAVVAYAEDDVSRAVDSAAAGQIPQGTWEDADTAPCRVEWCGDTLVVERLGGVSRHVRRR